MAAAYLSSFTETRSSEFNRTHREVYSIQHEVIKFVTGRWFSPFTPASSSTNKTDIHDITEILLKEALNTVNLIDSIMCVGLL